MPTARPVNGGVVALRLQIPVVFYSSLADMATTSGWEIRRAASLPEANDLIRSHSTPLVILDRSDSGQDWRWELGRLCTGSCHPCVILASGVVDDNLKGEVLRHRGYDVLPPDYKIEEADGSGNTKRQILECAQSVRALV